MDVQHPVLSLAIEPKTKADKEKLGLGLQKLMAEDPTFRVQTDQQTGQVIVAGMGELHLEIARRASGGTQMGVAADLKRPICGHAMARWGRHQRCVEGGRLQPHQTSSGPGWRHGRWSAALLQIGGCASGA